MLLWRPTTCRQRALALPGVSLRRIKSINHHRRGLLTVAIETSCDDTSVAVLEKATTPSGTPRARLLFHEKITADNSLYQGIHPLRSLESHQVHLPDLLQRALRYLPRRDHVSFDTVSLTSASGAPTHHRKPDFITATRGPGMRSSLSAGLDVAKGLCIAWSLPLVGAHHMQAHALTPRLVAALDADGPTSEPAPSFPFLTLLASGGHTLLLHSTSLTTHHILASTSDIALGDALDKLARAILSPAVLASAPDTSYGRLLEHFVFPTTSTPVSPHYAYTPPARRQEELARITSPWGWGLLPPLAETRSGAKSKSMEFSFSGLDSSVRRIVAAREAVRGGMDEAERRWLAREAMRVAFEHLASRVLMALQKMAADTLRTSSDTGPKVHTLVLSGGVAANQFLRHILTLFLSARGHEVTLSVPPVALCTDNAAMIAWAGVEMWEAGWVSEMGCLPLRKWALDPGAEDGGVLGVGGWVSRNERA